MKDLIERKAVRWPKRKHDGVFGSRGLQFEVELAAETLAQRESPGAIQTAAEGRVQHELHAAAVIEEPFEDEIVLRRHHAENDLRARQILDDLFGGRACQPDFPDEPLHRRT